MEFKTTCSTDPFPGQASGFTLVELLIGLGVSGIVLTVLVAMMLYSGHSFAGLANYADLNTKSLHALDRLTKDIRQATRLTSYSTNQIVFDCGTNQPALAFVYDPSARTLVRRQGGNEELLLTECDNLRFSIFQRTPQAGTYDQYPTATPETCKVVVVNWVCSRRILGTRFNTESVHTAKIVIRKH